jgi:hypothetical protein
VRGTRIAGEVCFAPDCRVGGGWFYLPMIMEVGWLTRKVDVAKCGCMEFCVKLSISHWFDVSISILLCDTSIIVG